MSGNTSAVLDVVSENADIKTIKEGNTSLSQNDGSLIQSASIDSFSTIQDIENLSELNVDGNTDLCITVDNPQKHLETLETYITFRITTKVARVDWPFHEYVVRRRYNDFLWIRQKLLDDHPFCIVPPLPGKHSLIGQLDRYSKDFIVVRMKALNVFISRIDQHPILSCNDHFKSFITMPQPDFTRFRRRNAAGSQGMPALPHSALKNKHVEFEKIKTYLHLLLEKIGAFEKISNRIQKERNDLIVELQYFYPHLQYWAGTEPELAPLLTAIAQASEKTMAAQNELVAQHTTLVTTPIKDFAAYAEVVQEALQKRDAHQAVYEEGVEELTRKRAEKDRLLAEGSIGQQQPASTTTSSGGMFSLWKQPSTDEKLEKLAAALPALTKRVEGHQDSMECSNEQLRSDVERWQSEKQAIVKQMLLDFANKQIAYYEASVNAWEAARGQCTK